MISEMEKIDFILKEGAVKGTNLKEFIELQIKEFEESDKRKLMFVGQKYYENDETKISKKKRYYIDDNSFQILN